MYPLLGKNSNLYQVKNLHAFFNKNSKLPMFLKFFLIAKNAKMFDNHHKVILSMFFTFEPVRSYVYKLCSYKKRCN